MKWLALGLLVLGVCGLLMLLAAVLLARGIRDDDTPPE